ncbi:MAG: hypothetical protein FJ320_07115 [SAR202 cluster bacterium]|nr:hypothetical protein [SAR202 cluster bacterium]
MALLQTSKGRTYSFSHCVGTLFAWSAPTDMALGEKDTIYVASRSYDPGGPFGPPQRWTKWDLIDDTRIFDAGSPGTGDGEFLWPSSIALDAQGSVYVADEYLNRISVFTTEGQFVGKWGTAGEGPGQLAGPVGMRFHRDGNLYVSESGNHRVQKFSKDGKPLGQWGRYGGGPGELNMPYGLHIDDDGNIFVADWGNDRVQKLSPDGTFIMHFGHPGTGPGQLQRPTSVATDKDGDVYVADWGNNRVNIYAKDGEFIMSLYGDARELSKSGKAFIDANPDIAKARRRADTSVEWGFRRPSAVLVDGQNRLLVIESISGRIQFYQKEDGYSDPQFNL